MKKFIAVLSCISLYAPDPKGLENLGVTCYINSVLQCLKVLPELTRTIKDYQGHDKLTNEFKALLNNKDVPHDNTPYNPISLVSCLSDQRVMQGININRMQDAEEFFINFLHALEPKDAIKKLFNIKYELTRNPLSPINIDSFVVPINKNYIPQGSEKSGMYIEDLTEQFFSVSKPTIIEYDTPNGTGKRNIVEKNILVSAPQYLVVRVPRFDYDLKTGSTLKLTTPFFSNYEPLVLSAKPDNMSEQRHTYHLVGVVFHDGKNLGSGHYTAVVKTANGTYFFVNDMHVRPISEIEFGAILSGNSVQGIGAAREGYLYFFERMNKQEMTAEFKRIDVD